MILRFGNTAVPYTVSWSSEERPRVGYCPFSKSYAICQDVSPGEGKPQFGKPHWQRQREVIAHDRCDLCAKSLKNRTKVSLSHAQPRIGADGPCILQVEPLLHRGCALESMKHCPSLRRDVAAGTLVIRQVNSHRVQFAISHPEFVDQYVHGYEAKSNERIVAHAKVELIRWIDRPEAWLQGRAA